jgi:hypothetical protein
MVSMNSVGTFCRSLYFLLGNRRHFERRPASGAVAMTIHDKYGEPTTHNCHLIDISEAGVGIESPEAAAPNTDVYLEFEFGRLKSFARIRYCQQRGSAYAVGLAFRPAPNDRAAGGRHDAQSDSLN